MKAHVVATGSGPPVVLLHSSGMSSRQWARLAARLSPRFRALALDFLGSGASPAAGVDFTVADDRDEVLALLDAQAEPSHLVCHSYGGAMALWVTRARPERVRSLALVEPVAFGVLHARGETEALAELGTDVTFGVAPGSEAWLRVFLEYWGGPGAWDALPGPVRATFVKAGPKVYQEVRDVDADRTTDRDYAALDVPALVMHGARTTVAARRTAEILAEALPRATLRVLEGAGHMAPLTHADEVNAAIEVHLMQAQEAAHPAHGRAPMSMR